MRVYFHLMNGREAIADREGIEVSLASTTPRQRHSKPSEKWAVNRTRGSATGLAGDWWPRARKARNYLRLTSALSTDAPSRFSARRSTSLANILRTCSRTALLSASTCPPEDVSIENANLPDERVR